MDDDVLKDFFCGTEEGSAQGDVAHVRATTPPRAHEFESD